MTIHDTNTKHTFLIITTKMFVIMNQPYLQERALQ